MKHIKGDTMMNRCITTITVLGTIILIGGLCSAKADVTNLTVQSDTLFYNFQNE
jgi:hypothetical protein